MQSNIATVVAFAALCFCPHQLLAESQLSTGLSKLEVRNKAHSRVAPARRPDPSLAPSFFSGHDELTRFRKVLAGAGITYGIYYTGDTLGNVSGGFVAPSTHYIGLLALHLDVDLGKSTGWQGLSGHVDFYQIHGTSITAENIGSIVSVSNIEASPSTRLRELWFEQRLFHDLGSVRFGQLAADSEFLISEVAANFIASTFGWTTLSSDNLPYGGPIYPFATPGVRFCTEPYEHLKLKLGIYNGDPVGPCSDDLDPGRCNRHGLEFRLKDPPLLLVEGVHSYNQEGSGLPGTIKLGGWYHLGEFEDQRFDLHGGLQGSTRAAPLRHEGNYGVYAVIDQMIYRPHGLSDTKGIFIFARAVMSPSERNQIDAYADAGIVFAGMVPRRPNDVIGLGVAYTSISANASDFDRDSGLSVIRNYEALLELNYIAEIAPGLAIQPVVQYIRNPGGSVPEDHNERANRRIEDVVVLGLRTVLSY